MKADIALLLLALPLNKGIIRASDGDLEAASSLFERVALFFGAAVFVGIVAEVWLAWSGYTDVNIIDALLASLGRPSANAIGHWGPVLADSVVAIGVGGEVWFASRASRCQSELTRRSNDRLAIAEKEAAEARRELIELRTPRRDIMSGKWPGFSAALSPFAGTIFDAGLSAGGEIMHFWWDLAHGLQAAGWKHIAWFDHSGMRMIQNPLPPSGVVESMNVEIHLHHQSRSALLPATNALIATLVANGVAAKEIPFNVHSQSAHAIHITVGQKW